MTQRQVIRDVVAGTRPGSELADHYNEVYFAGHDADVAHPYGKPDYHARRNRMILGELDIRSNSRVLECGCGCGQVVHMLATEFGCRITGVDFSQKAIDWCRVAYGHSGFICASVDALPIADVRFDVVLAMDVTEHLLHDVYLAALAEFFRVLKPGGRCAVLPGVDATFPEHINVLPIEQIAADMQAVGFETELLNALGADWILGRRP